jgi:MYXO-CTERM domain-containing protein
VSTWYYPGWEAEIDGRRRSIGPEAISGLIVIDLEEGEHDVVLRFVDTPDRVAGKIVSAVALAALAGLAGVALVRRRRR